MLRFLQTLYMHSPSIGFCESRPGGYLIMQRVAAAGASLLLFSLPQRYMIPSESQTIGKAILGFGQVCTAVNQNCLFIYCIWKLSSPPLLETFYAALTIRASLFKNLIVDSIKIILIISRVTFSSENKSVSDGDQLFGFFSWK